MKNSTTSPTNFPLSTTEDSYTIVWEDGAEWSSFTLAHAQHIISISARFGWPRKNEA